MLEMYLRCMTHLEPKRWKARLSLVEWWHNTTYHTAIRMNPFEALYGISQRNAAAVQWLVQWWRTSPTEATWKDAEEIERKFPGFQS